MKNMAAVSLLLLLLVSCNTVALAGGYVDSSPVVSSPDKIIAPDSPMPPPPIVETKIVERIVEKTPPKPDRSYGFAAGIIGQYPVLVWAGSDFEIAAGYSSRLGDQSAIIQGAGYFYKSADGWTNLKAGLALFPGNGPLCGLFAGAEQFITSNISLTGDIHGIQFGNDKTNLCVGVLGARVYF